MSEEVKEPIVYITIKQRTTREEESYQLAYSGIQEHEAFSFKPDDYYDCVTVTIMSGTTMIREYQKWNNQSKFTLNFDLTNDIKTREGLLQKEKELVQKMRNLVNEYEKRTLN